MDSAKKYSCKCGVAFTSERSLNFHRGSRACRLRDPEAIRFTCADCKFTAYYQITLDKHRQIRHSSKISFPCKCGDKFGALEALLEHQQTSLGCKKYHTCKLCGHISPTQGQLNRHFRSHSEEKPFVCECGRAYPRKDSYYRHQRGCSSVSASELSASAGISVGTRGAAATRLGRKESVPGVPSGTPGPMTSAPVAAPPSASSSLPTSAAAPSPRDEKLPTLLPPASSLPHYNSDPRVFPANPPPPMVQVHSQVFMPHYSGHYVWMNPSPAHPQSEAPPQPNQLLNLSYLASMKRRIDLPVPSDQDVPCLE